ncbi:hypothetical protein FGO68_gene6355 [Halteria grandinella]|uniref:Uncharacterized protein n=1 Tax=Halteria grandinella TaxID=5974 RepID=A0A8J8NCB5_HALGN|nr:hypothetical protein FGO68_gene6355 [Halteria grandinella]
MRQQTSFIGPPNYSIRCFSCPTNSALLQSTSTSVPSILMIITFMFFFLSPSRSSMPSWIPTRLIFRATPGSINSELQQSIIWSSGGISDNLNSTSVNSLHLDVAVRSGNQCGEFGKFISYLRSQCFILSFILLIQTLKNHLPEYNTNSQSLVYIIHL